jgi:hypothetical protein
MAAVVALAHLVILAWLVALEEVGTGAQEMAAQQLKEVSRVLLGQF